MILSIIIPSYQHFDYVTTCLANAVEIPVLEKEIIVIDDGSKDGSPDLIKHWIATHPNSDVFHFIQHENRGLVRVLNEGLAYAKGEYIYFVASDDIPIAGGVKELLTKLESNEGAQFALGNARAFIKGGVEWLTYGDSHNRFFELLPGERNTAIFLDYPVPLLLQAGLFRRKILINIGGWDETLLWDDYPMFVKLFNACPNINIDFIYCPNVCVVSYRQHEKNAYRNIEKQVSMIVQALEVLCPINLKNKAISRIYARFFYSALKKLKFSMAANFFKLSSRSSNLKITIAEVALIFTQLAKNRLMILLSRIK